ncbi:DUF2459 domain-containing protein [Cupriavidus pauculus]|uniref:DUF2459 domain-containing protein n=1 Tax=Cupriavidus pauculus TaxID=82633 RepID=A0A2N5CBU3_9BURK|nr:DUF2459 domain-containing protein [Cupriavidus pauculus]PLP99678.1 DUF2459 domain-containing protein [Cupriavidus pauculus]
MPARPRIAPTCAATMLAMTLVMSGCATAPAAVAAPRVTTISVVERDWHTDICIRTVDADARLMRVARGYDGSTYLCFGFGDRHYLITGERGPMTLLSALLPGDGAILLTILRDTPAAAFGAGNVVDLELDEAGIGRLRAFLNRTVQENDAGEPQGLGNGPYPGGLYFGATARYNGFYTCNTWTADGLREAGIPMHGPVLFAEGVMRQVRDLAAARQGAPQADSPAP